MITPSFSLTATERVLPKLALDFTTASLDPRVTFTRTGDTATVTNSSGYVVPINANLPRFDYNPITLVCKGLLIEESRSNLLTYSEQFDDNIWVKGTNILPPPTVTADTSISPSGTLTADTYTRNSTGENRLRYTTAQAANTSYVLSVFAKAGTASFLRLRNLAQSTETNTWFNLSTGAVGTVSAGTSSASITSFGNGWYRCSITVTTSAVIANNFIDIANSANDGSISGSAGNTTLIWGAQLEAGAFATSYIPTTTTALTRNADVATMTGTNFSSWYNATEGSFEAESILLPGISANFYSVYRASDGTGNNFIESSYNGGGPTLGFTVKTLGSNVVNMFQTVPAFSAASVNKVCGTYKANSFAVSVNATAPSTDSAGALPTIDRLNIGSNTWVQKLNYWPQRLINAQVQALSK